jgi:hypothetical protein
MAGDFVSDQVKSAINNIIEEENDKNENEE